MRQKILLLLVLFQWGCGSSISNSYVDQQRNREMDISQQLYADYSKVVGTYTGSGGPYESIEAVLRVTDSLPDGYLVAQPRITGAFTVTPKVVTGSVAVDGGVETPTLRDGTYNASTRKIVGHFVGVNSLGADINCTFRDSTFNVMDCKWIPVQGKYFEFVLTRT